MSRVRLHIRLIAVALALAAPGVAAQTGSFWQGFVDANIPVDFYAERFNDEGIEGRIRFGAARFGFADINRLCDAARLKATREGDHYAYRLSGRCGGKGTLRVAIDDPNRLEGRGTLYDAASASSRKRRHFYMDRQ